jgi:hypothetical protein
MDPKLLNTPKSTRRNLGWVVVILLIVAGYLQYYKATRSHLGPGILVPEDPEMSQVNYTRTWKENGYNILPLASINIRGRVLSVKRYYWDRAADLSPVDVMLGWGELSDQRVLDNLSFSQSDRGFAWKTTKPINMTESYVSAHLANFHLIPANAAIKKVIKSLHSNEVINMSGYLVRVTADDGYTWSSMHKTATFGRIFWVESITIVMQ